MTKAGKYKPAAASILFMGKRDDRHCATALDKLRSFDFEIQPYLARRGDSWPAPADTWRGDYIITYLSPFIIPDNVLKNARQAAINFHPGPPAYPGIGCTNFAIYNGERDFGVTCHHMAAAVDTGPIIAVRRFPLYPIDSVYDLTQRCYDAIQNLFFEVIEQIASGAPLPDAGETWTRAPYRRTELEALCRITPDMEKEEIERRVRATTFPGAPGAHIELHGHRFDYASAAE